MAIGPIAVLFGILILIGIVVFVTVQICQQDLGL